MSYKLSIFIFHRDLRLTDNIGLIMALKRSEFVIPIFIFNQEQIDPKKNKYFSNNAVQFMCESISELHNKIKKLNGELYLFHSKNQYTLLNNLIKQIKPEACFSNFDYTPYSIERDKKIKLICEKNKIGFHMYEDAVLNPIKSVMKPDKTPYRKFTPYYLKALTIPVRKPIRINKAKFKKIKITSSELIHINSISQFYKPNDQLAIHGGSSNGESILKNIKKFKNYSKEHNFPIINTTQLSPHLKFGTVSPRHVYQVIKKHFGLKSALLRQLYWREFYYYLGFHFPKALTSAFNPRYRKLKWSYNQKHLKLWQKGMTGIPIVDAGMRQLNQTGFMHNRVRLITASFLVKDLHINWQVGEQYFANKLVDYCPWQNNGNWQWVAGTGVDSQPYFRIFNPGEQAKKYDQNCEYIKKYIPELKDIDNKHILKWDTYYKLYPKINYPKPIIDHHAESLKAIKLYQV